MSDTLTALQKALSPKTGMQRIPLPLDIYEHPSIPLSSKRLLNYYAEQEPSDALVAAALIPTPGLVTYTALGSPPIRAVNGEMPGRLYVVANDHFYRISYPPGLPSGIEDLGAVGISASTTGLVTIAVGMTAVVVCVPPNAFTCSHQAGTPLNPIGGDFPGAASVAHMDGYFAFTAYEDSTRWFISYLLDPTAFDALDFVYADAMPNVIRIIVGHGGEFWLMGEKGIEVWYDAGSSGLETTPGVSFFPFRRRAGATINGGTLSPKSVQTGDGSVWWIGDDNIVFRSNGYRKTRVSNHAIEAQITDRLPGDADGCLFYEMDGHSFYCFTIDDKTFAADAATGTWHERSSTADGTGRWRANCAAQFSNAPVFGDFNTGQLMQLARRTGTDLGVPLVRQGVLPPITATTAPGVRVFCARVEVEMEVGTDASHDDVLLEWSDDGGYTFTGSRTMTSGPLGAGRKRVYTTRLGSFRQRVFRLTTHGAATIYAVDADIVPGSS